MPLLNQLIAPWNLPGPVAFRRLEEGYINEIYAVDAPGSRYILRIYRDPGDLTGIRHEHRIATSLQQAGLSFAIPAPIPSVRGETLETVAGPDGPLHVALIPFLTGVHPDFQNLAHAQLAGQGLGELVAALERFEPDEAVRAIPTYGELARLLPGVADPFEAVDWLPAESDWCPRLRQVLTDAMTKAPELYKRLPRQVIHGDFTHGNVLVEGERITGVFDFELSTFDLRAMDYAIGVGGGPKSLRDGWGDWEVLEAFSRGYFSRHRLTGEELEALPDLIRIRRVNILLKFAGRYRLGLDEPGVAQGMAWWTLNAEDWLEANATDLVRHARRWAGL